MTYVHGVKKGSNDQELAQVIQRVFLAASNNLSWLKPGDLVLLKPALNSPDPYPATTHPLAVKVVADLLIQRNAKVVIGDQSGIEHVLQDSTGVIRGNSIENFKKSGMVTDSKYQLVGFEQGDWDKDFYKFQSAKTIAWPNGFYVTKWVEKADHIISLPRLSTHGQAGMTLGFKNIVGILRQDSRMHFHSQGPFYFFFKKSAKHAKFDKYDDKQKDFFKKITEISLAIQEKLRLTLFVGTQAQLTMGPDAKIGGILKSYVVEPEQGLVFASQNPVATEMFAIALMTYLYKDVPWTKKLGQKLLLLINSQAKDLGKYNPWQHPFVKHGLAIGLGMKETEFDYKNVPDSLIKDLSKLFSG